MVLVVDIEGVIWVEEDSFQWLQTLQLHLSTYDILKTQSCSDEDYFGDCQELGMRSSREFWGWWDCILIAW